MQLAATFFFVKQDRNQCTRQYGIASLIAGGIAEAFYGGVPAEIQSRAFEFLDETLITTIREFHETHLQS